MKKKIFLLVTMAAFASLNAQDLKVHLLSPKGIIGTGMPNDKIMIDFNADGLEDETTTADVNGNFKYTFKPENIVKSGVKKLTEGSEIWIWGLREVEEPKITAGVKDAPPPKKILITSAQKATVGSKKADTPVLKNQTVYTNATILTTNFNIPVARFDFTKKENRTDAIGNINLFTSVGAGIGVHWGEKKTIYNNQAEITSEEFKNIIGLNGGFLFSAQTGEDKKNIFAPTINLTILDFQIGTGYELGSLQSGQSPFFLTFSYSIPLYKLVKTGFLTLHGKKHNGFINNEIKSYTTNASNTTEVDTMEKEIEKEIEKVLQNTEEVTLELENTSNEKDITKLKQHIQSLNSHLNHLQNQLRALNEIKTQNALKSQTNSNPPATITTPVNPKTTSSFSKD